MYLRNGFGDGVYGALDEQNEGGTDITITTAGVHYGWQTAQTVVMNGGMTADFTGAADGFKLPDLGGGGDFLILGSISFSGTPNIRFEGHIYIDDVESHAGFFRKLGAGGDVGAAPISDIITVPDGGKVDLRFSGGSNGSTFTIEGCHLVLARLHK
jgi:hypothetical protein